MALDLTQYGATAQPVQTQASGLDLTKYGATNVATTPVAPAQPNYVQHVGADYAQAGQDITSGIKNSADQINQGNPLGFIRAGLRTAGGVAHAAFAPILEAPGVKQVIDAIGNTVSAIPGAHTVIQKATDLAAKHPEVAKDLQNIVDIATLGAGGALEKPFLTEAQALSQDASSAVKTALTPSEQSIQSKVISLFDKSIKPTAQKTTALADRYQNNVVTALRTIQNNAPNLNIEDASGELVSRAPHSINELSQALDQTKTSIFNQYDALAKKAGTEGATIDANPIATELDSVSQNKAIQLTSPGVIDYAKQWADRLRSFGTLDTQTTQEVIKIMNSNLQAFYKNPTYDAASRVTVDAGIANNFRKALDTAIEKATGENYQGLKNQYAALKAIENDVVRASMRDARKNAKGLLDYTDMFTGGQMVSGILSLNPAMFTKGAVERGLKEYIKYLNDPNRAVKNMFDAIGKPAAQPFTPKSKTVNAVKRATGSSAGNQ